MTASKRSFGAGTPPCRLCAFAIRITATRQDHGRWCIWYGVRVPADELDRSTSALRMQCLRDGNNFQWPLAGLSSERLLEWRMRLSDWQLQRSTMATQKIAAVVSLVLSGIAIAVSVAALVVR